MLINCAKRKRHENSIKHAWHIKWISLGWCCVVACWDVKPRKLKLGVTPKVTFSDISMQSMPFSRLHNRYEKVFKVTLLRNDNIRWWIPPIKADNFSRFLAQTPFFFVWERTTSARLVCLTAIGIYSCLSKISL